MVVLLIMLLSSSIRTIYTCMPTSPSPMPQPIPCRLCSPTKILISANSEGFSTDSPSVVNGCSVRTVTCAGRPDQGRYIRWNGVNVINADATGTATLMATCNAAGTGWTYLGMPVTEMGCYTGCLQCLMSLITVYNTNPFAGDTPSVVNGCMDRTLICTNPNLPNPPTVPFTWSLLWWNTAFGGGNIGQPNSNMRTTMITMTCNAAGTAWMYQVPFPARAVRTLECIWFY